MGNSCTPDRSKGRFGSPDPTRKAGSTRAVLTNRTWKNSVAPRVMRLAAAGQAGRIRLDVLEGEERWGSTGQPGIAEGRVSPKDDVARPVSGGHPSGSVSHMESRSSIRAGLFLARAERETGAFWRPRCNPFSSSDRPPRFWWREVDKVGQPLNTTSLGKRWHFCRIGSVRALAVESRQVISTEKSVREQMCWHQWHRTRWMQRCMSCRPFLRGTKYDGFR
jgi:hypothetical protein